MEVVNPTETLIRIKSANHLISPIVNYGNIEMLFWKSANQSHRLIAAGI
jgi:hypothetical protein